LRKKLIEANNILSLRPAKVHAPVIRIGALKWVSAGDDQSVVVGEFGGSSLQADQVDQLKCIPLPF
jgi:hypothetical protein